jgi:tetratricopeptide (TPR) repeat protein
MKMLAPLALLALSAAPVFAAAASTDDVRSSADTPARGTLDSSKIRLDSQDASGAFADAEAVIARGGGADAYAARGDAERALGRPVDEAIEDYRRAAELDPRYIEKYKGLIAQRDSEARPGSGARSAGKGLNGVPIAEVGAAALAGVLLVAVGAWLSRRGGDSSAPDDEPSEKPRGDPPPPESK